MTYLIVNKTTNPENAGIYDIADFLWNNGNEVFLWDNLENQNTVNTNLDFIVFVYDKDYSPDYKNKSTLYFPYLEKFSINSFPEIMTFCNSGIYCSLFPYPHKIFLAEKINKKRLSDFFQWCIKLNLFIN